MIRGFATFKEHFQGFEDQYVIIGRLSSAIKDEEVNLKISIYQRRVKRTHD